MPACMWNYGMYELINQLLPVDWEKHVRAKGGDNLANIVGMLALKVPLALLNYIANKLHWLEIMYFYYVQCLEKTEMAPRG